MHKVRTMVDVKIKIALGLIAIMVLAAPVTIAQEVPPHVVISEVQIATNEFVELYNPTNSAVDMTDWHWCYFSPGRNWNNSYSDKSFPEGAIIPAHGFYLIGLKGFPEPSSDWQVYNSTQLADSGSVGIFPWDPDTKTAEEAKAGKIDAVGWGSVTYVYETATASTPGSGESIEREPLKEGYAPCQDTDDNSVDFDEPGTPTPKNISSLEMEPAPVELFNADGDLKGSFVNIQDAVGNASDGYTIRVDNGTYEENLDVGRPLTICSEHGAAVTTISAPNPNDNVFDVTADYVTITGFNVIGATAKGGIYLCNADYCNIANNSASNNKIGIHLQMGSQHNTITNNTVSNNIQRGIWLAQSNSNKITNSNVSDNENGISLSSSDDNSIHNNYFDNMNNADDNGNNIWNITKTVGTNIIGGPNLGGNYWSDYAGADTDNDGLGDLLLPYNSSGDIEDGGDSHPLVHVAAPKLSIVKSDEPDPVPPGGTLNYTIIVKNTRYEPATDSSKQKSESVQSISVTKLGNVTAAAPSTLVNFNITVSNIGDSRLTPVVVTDTLPQGMTYKYSYPRANSTNGTIICDNVGPLDVDASETITLVARVGENATGVLTNAVDVTGTTENGTNVSASDTAQVNVIRVAIEKSCKSSTVSLGGTVEYTITYSNPGEVNLTNVVITENYPKNLTFISAVPAPDSGTNNRWTIGTLPAGESGKITVVMKVPASMSDLSYTESGSVSGEGIVMISKELSTKVEPYDLKNVVTISGSYGATTVSATASAITTVSASGSSLEITEHGSGTYESEEEISLSSENMGIKFDKYTKASYSPTTFKCSDGFVMEVPSKWSQDICTKSYAKNSAIHKKITGATYLRDLTTGKADNKVCTMYIGSSFVGYLHVDRKAKDAATSEHYIGDFDVEWELGEERVKGVGYVIVDKELSSGRLLLMEHGSGYYLSEDDSGSSSIKKTLYAEYEPTSFNFSDGFVVNFSSMWMQDICARSTTGTSALHKKIRDATYIDDDTTARSSPSLKFVTFFYGATHVGSRSRYSRSSEDYIGDFYISWGASSIFIFDWDKVPGADNDTLIMHLYSEDRFGMPWVMDDDVEITKSAKKDTIVIFTPEHSAEIILDTETSETADLIVDGVYNCTFNVEKRGDTLKVYDSEFERKPEEVIGEGFVMVDEAIFRDGEIQVTEHGSGIYRSGEVFGSKTIEKETYGEYKPTYFSFSDSFSVNYSSKWMQDICAKDEDEGTAIHKKISDAALMNDDTIAAKSLMNFTSSFNGSMHIGARTENVNISEDYIGEFNVTQLIKIVKEKPSESSSEPSDWLFCPYPIP
ncbi:MAG: NosD domain-containing protein [Halobacteriota archaeon]